MANDERATQAGIGWLWGLVILLILLAGVWWWMRAAPAEAPAVDSPEVGVVTSPPPMPRT
ncbi:MAG: hypothetical protein KY453_08515 [Gemmatimonadetes bacterium]|nr:hypothetical protein [Gemmatimonadota bacterium]